MQQREGTWTTRTPLEALLARTDDAALDYVTDQLLAGRDLDQPPAQDTPAAGATEAAAEPVEAG